MPDQTDARARSAQMLQAALNDPEQRAVLNHMIAETAERTPALDDFSWLEPLRSQLTTSRAGERNARLSLHGVDPEDALRAMLRTPPVTKD